MELNTALTKTKSVALPFLVGLSIYSIIGATIYALLGKEEAHLFFNSYHSSYSDLFFKYITYIGDGMLPVFVTIILLLVRYSWGIAMGISSIIMGIIIQTLKRSIFAGDHRPAMFFSGEDLQFVDGVELMLHHSFPSGHSATAFCLCLLLAFFVKKKWATYTFLVLAILAAFSRVYISQHFIQDTIVGSWVGAFAAYLGYLIIVRYAEENPSSELNKRLWP